MLSDSNDPNPNWEINNFIHAIRIASKLLSPNMPKGAIKSKFLLDESGASSFLTIVPLNKISSAEYSIVRQRFEWRIKHTQNKPANCSYDATCCIDAPEMGCVMSAIPDGKFGKPFALFFMRDLLAIEWQKESIILRPEINSQKLKNNKAYISFETSSPNSSYPFLLLEINPERLQASLGILSEFMRSAWNPTSIDFSGMVAECKNGNIAMRKPVSDLSWHQWKKNGSLRYQASEREVDILTLALEGESLWIDLKNPFETFSLPEVSTGLNNLTNAISSCLALSHPEKENLKNLISDEKFSRLFYLSLYAIAYVNSL